MRATLPPQANAGGGGRVFSAFLRALLWLFSAPRRSFCLYTECGIAVGPVIVDFGKVFGQSPCPRAGVADTMFRETNALSRLVEDFHWTVVETNTSKFANVD